MDEDMSPMFLGSLKWSDTLEIFRRDIDSYAIALYTLSWEKYGVTRWGLFSFVTSSHTFFWGL